MVQFEFENEPASPVVSMMRKFELFKIKFCKLFGHRWMYKDYSNSMKPDGAKYDFTASRNCTRCSQHAYFYDNWKNGKKSKLDFENDMFASGQITINSINYF